MMKTEQIEGLTTDETAALSRAIHCVWNAIAPDAGEFCSSNEDIVEMCIDADRIPMFMDGEPETAEAAVVAWHKLRSGCSYAAALKRVAKVIHYV